jgi:hypothetical protein
MSKTIIGIVIAVMLTGVYLHFTTSYAETQVPTIVTAIQADPYYFSEGGFGIGILKYYGIPLTPYLTPGTSEDSSLADILNSYNKANEKTELNPIVDDQNRARYYVVHFWDTSYGSNTFTTFSKFQPIITKNPLTPIGSQKYTSGFSLGSLPTKYNQWFYNSIINDYINPGKVPIPFNADVDILTGDGNILQTYYYKNCQVNGYVPFLSSTLIRLPFFKQFQSGVRDETDFTCSGFLVNFDLRKPSADWPTVKNTIDSLPDQKDLIQKYIVTISSDIFKSGQTYQTFSSFTPMGAQTSLPLPIPSNSISGQSKGFSLESLPSKDKEQFYQYVVDKLNNKRQVQPVDISVDLVTGDGTILQTWKYPRCDVTNYSTYRQEISAIWKFTQSNEPEIRDKTFFACTGLKVNFMPNYTNSSQTFNGPVIPSDDDRAQVFTVHFSGGDMKNGFDYTFLKFAPFSKDYQSFALPDYAFGNKPKFYLESLPSKDKGTFYQLVNKYVTPSSVPQPFDVSIDLTSGDGSTIQTWKYTKCEITKYQPYLQSFLTVNMFTEKFQPEIRDRSIFQCSGLSLDGPSKTTNLNTTQTIRTINYIPSDSDRAQFFVVKFSNGDFQTPQKFFSFADFQPDLSASDQVKTTYSQIKSSSFTLLSLSSKDKTEFYNLISRFVNPTYKPNLFDVSVELVTGDGSIVQTWQYQKCTAANYQIFLQNTLLYYTFSGKKAISEPQDKTTFNCGGFSINFSGGTEDLSNQPVIPSDNSRVVIYATHLTSNVFPATRTSGLAQEFDTLGNQQFQVQSLPNKYSKGGYELVSKYINPSAPIELFDVNVDLITGDGTKLFSIIYPRCSGTNYSIFSDNNIADIKYTPSIKFEIRDKSIVKCSGVNTVILPKDNPNNIIGPIVQQAIGIPDDKIACNQGFQLVVRPPLNNTACVKISHVSKFTQRGWNAEITNHNLSNLIRPIIPTDDERAMSIRATFQGTDIPTQTITTFSNFAPISQGSPTTPSYSLTGGGKTTPMFYLESLPSKDKAAVYHLVSMYLNPGIVPNLFDVKVEILNGDGSTLQTWKFTKCQMTNYEPFLDENGLTYKLHLKWQPEIKDRTTFGCSGLNLGLG